MSDFPLLTPLLGVDVPVIKISALNVYMNGTMQLIILYLVYTCIRGVLGVTWVVGVLISSKFLAACFVLLLGPLASCTARHANIVCGEMLLAGHDKKDLKQVFFVSCHHCNFQRLTVSGTAKPIVRLYRVVWVPHPLNTQREGLVYFA